ncbi:MAG: tetratricopeptide repeat protein [Acidobacteriia bacterium]|nr:tetratricopeptide repeat protein [Terriglobia bacterium]
MRRFPATVGMMAILLATVVAGVEARADHAAAVSSYRDGNALFDQDRFAEAAAAYSRAIAEDPQYAEAYHNLALATEMIERQKAIKAWRRFLDVAANREDLKYDVGRARARLQLLESMPALPEPMQPSHYVSAAGDYYWTVSSESEGNEWTSFPVKVFLGSAPQLKWQEGAREAYDNWSKVFPLELVALPQGADIRIGWHESMIGEEHVGEESDWLQTRYEGGGLKGRKYALIRVDLSRLWSKDEMRAIMSHEIGHALGIKGHSESKGDIMYWQVQESIRQIGTPRIPLPLFWRSLVKQPSQRDINTLIRLYNTAGSSKRFR